MKHCLITFFIATLWWATSIGKFNKKWV